MSLNSALTAALGGLTANARKAETVSSNIANALTPGYGRREIELASRTAGNSPAGVRIVGERRMVDVALTNDRRGAEAKLAQVQVQIDALAAFERVLGLPGAPGALTTRIAALEAALTEASSRPDQPVRLEAVARTASELAEGLNRTSRSLDAAAMETDRRVEDGVTRLDTALREVERLNTTIQRQILRGDQPNGLMDQRQRLIDSISDLVPLREIQRPQGQVALFTEGGAILLDGRAAKVGLSSGTPAQITLDGRAVGTGPAGLMGGGSLAGMIDLRDTALPEMRAGLDNLALDLIERFRLDPPADGLFRDTAGLDPAIDGIEGLAGRVGLHPLGAPPAPAPELWRLRDGLDATAPGLPSDSTQLRAFAAALEDVRPPAAALPGSAWFAAPMQSFTGFASELQSRLGGLRFGLEDRAAFFSAQGEGLRDAEARNGVDTDTEMQKLLMVERAYAANARVIQAADEMLQRLMAL
jgi:flagellar hook-associated protein 1 FlgK